MIKSDTASMIMVEAAWLHYDDRDDHRVRLTKTEWDYFQRLLSIFKCLSQIK